MGAEVVKQAIKPIRLRKLSTRQYGETKLENEGHIITTPVLTYTTRTRPDMAKTKRLLKFTNMKIV